MELLWEMELEEALEDKQPQHRPPPGPEHHTTTEPTPNMPRPHTDPSCSDSSSSSMASTVADDSHQPGQQDTED